MIPLDETFLDKNTKESNFAESRNFNIVQLSTSYSLAPLLLHICNRDNTANDLQPFLTSPAGVINGTATDGEDPNGPTEDLEIETHSRGDVRRLSQSDFPTAC